MRGLTWVFLISLILGFSMHGERLSAQGEQVYESPSSNVLIGSKNPTACLKQLQMTSLKYEKERVQSDRLQSELASCKAKGITAIDKIGFVAMGALVAFTNGNIFSLVAVGYLIIFQ